MYEYDKVRSVYLDSDNREEVTFESNVSELMRLKC